jgi:hypothetical protein
MKFTRIAPHINMPIMCWRSDCGQLDIGFRSVIYGFRATVSEVHGQCYPVDYCVGQSCPHGIVVLSAIHDHLTKFTSNPDHQHWPPMAEIRRYLKRLPEQKGRPMETDNECFHNLIGFIDPDSNPPCDIGQLIYALNNIQTFELLTDCETHSLTSQR